MTQVHLHLPNGDLRTITATGSPTIWLEVHNRAQFDGFYAQTMSGTIHNERHIHYQYMGSTRMCVSSGYYPEDLDQYLLSPTTGTGGMGGIFGNPINPYQAPTPPNNYSMPPSIYNIMNGSSTVPVPFDFHTPDKEEEPPCVCRDPSVHSVHCQYIKWKRSRRHE